MDCSTQVLMCVWRFVQNGNKHFFDLFSCTRHFNIAVISLWWPTYWKLREFQIMLQPCLFVRWTNLKRALIKPILSSLNCLNVIILSSQVVDNSSLPGSLRSFKNMCNLGLFILQTNPYKLLKSQTRAQVFWFVYQLYLKGHPAVWQFIRCPETDVTLILAPIATSIIWGPVQIRDDMR